MKRKNIILLLGVIIIAVAASGLYYAARQSTTQTAHSVKIGYQALAGSWAFYVANEVLPGREKSFFAEQGLDVEAIRFDSSNNAAEAMLRGDIATDSATTMTVLFNIEERSPGTLKCFGFQVHTTTEFLESLIARKGSGIKGYGDLKGKKIGVFPGSLNQAITKLLLKDHLNPDIDVSIVRMTPPIQLQALTIGDVDALISYEPTTSIALAKGVAEIVEDSPWAKHIFEPFPVATYCFTTEYLNRHGETAQKIVRAWFKAIDYIRTNRDNASGTIPSYTEIEPSLAQKLNQPAQQKSTEVDRDAVQRLADLYLEFGIISRKIDTANIYYVPD